MSLIFRGTFFLTLSASVITGCGQKEEPESPATISESSAAPAASAVPSLAGSTAIRSAPQPEQWMVEAHACQETGDYEKAAQYLIAIQRQQQLLSQQQSAAYWKQMSAFQADLATRVASGDPNAKAAAERLRASALR